MDKHNMLRMLRHHQASQVKRIYCGHKTTFRLLLDDNLSNHLGVDRAVVRVCPGLGERVRIFIVRIECLRPK
jgi:hypothetical protein